MRSKFLGSVLGFIGAVLAVSVFYIGLVFAQTSTDTPNNGVSMKVAAHDTESETILASKLDASEVASEQEASEEKPKLSERATIEKELAREFAQSKSTLISKIDTGFSDSVDLHSKVSSQVSDIKVYFHVYNPLQERALLTINTGIRKGLLTYMRLEGATGYKWEDEELVIAYVPLPAGNSGLVTLTATPLISAEPLKIQVRSTLKNQGNAIIEVAKAEVAFVRPKSPTVLKNFGITRSKHQITETIDAQSSGSTPALLETASSADQVLTQ